MKIRNRRDRAVIVAPAGRDPIEVDAGAVVDVDDEVGASLLEQTDRWEAVKAKAPKTPAKGEEE